VLLVGKIGLGCGIATFIVLMIYWIIDFAVVPYEREVICQIPPDNFTVFLPDDNITVPLWVPLLTLPTISSFLHFIDLSSPRTTSPFPFWFPFSLCSALLHSFLSFLPYDVPLWIIFLSC
jgi:hypothetical protein